MIECPRCPAPLATLQALEAHLVELHCQSAARAQREARDAAANATRRGRPTPAPMAVAPAPEPEAGHTCARCGAHLACDWQAQASMEQQATRLRILSGMWKARLRGVTIGHPRRNVFDIDTARRLVAEGMTYAAVAEAVGASSPSAVKSQLARLRRAEAR